MGENRFSAHRRDLGMSLALSCISLFCESCHWYLLRQCHPRFSAAAWGFNGETHRQVCCKIDRICFWTRFFQFKLVVNQQVPSQKCFWDTNTCCIWLEISGDLWIFKNHSSEDSSWRQLCLEGWCGVVAGPAFGQRKANPQVVKAGPLHFIPLIYEIL